MMRGLVFLFFVLLPGFVFSQQLIFPDSVGWTRVREGKLFSFHVKCNDPVAPKYSLEGIDGYGIQFDTAGNFSWRPGFDLADRLENQKEVNLIFQAEWKDGRKVRTPVNFTVLHQNRPPEIDELPVFYVKQSTLNKYQISSDYVHDPDGDPLIFKVSPSQLLEGMSLSSFGLLTWTPSRNQFNSLKHNPFVLEFTVQDQPEKREVTGKIKIAQTQLDLPPEMLLVPGDTSFTIKENERINFKIYVTDPNGDDDVLNAGFLCSDERIPKSCFKENTNVQYEFTWSPGYSFTDDTEKEKIVEVIFFAVDKSNNRVQRKIKVKVLETENVEEKDKFLYQRYRSTLEQAKGLLELLKEKHKTLERDYRQAKKGKKNRSIFGASLGAGSAISSQLVSTPADLKGITMIGGTATATLGTLEAAEVMGKSKNDIMELIKTETEIRNQLQLEGDLFARKYALKSNRRTNDFNNDRDKFIQILNNPKLPTLELDASKPLNTKYDSKELKKTFGDFSEE